MTKIAERYSAARSTSNLKSDPRTGRYHLHCVGCCARLVRSCRPWREAQEGMFAIIARQPGRPGKAEVIAAIKGMDQQQGGGCRSA